MDIPDLPQFLKDLRDRLIHFQIPENQDIPRRNKPSSLTEEQFEKLPFAPLVVFRHRDHEDIGIWNGGDEIRWWSSVSSSREYPPFGSTKDKIQEYFKLGVWIRL